jgi:hypothetical protein
VQLPVNDLCHFSDTSAAQHFSNDGNGSFSRNAQALFKADIKPPGNALGHIPGGGDRKGPGYLGVQTLHRDPDQFAGHVNTAPEKRELRYAFADRIAGMREELGGDGKKLGAGHRY